MFCHSFFILCYAISFLVTNVSIGGALNQFSSLNPVICISGATVKMAEICTHPYLPYLGIRRILRTSFKQPASTFRHVACRSLIQDPSSHGGFPSSHAMGYPFKSLAGWFSLTANPMKKWMICRGIPMTLESYILYILFLSHSSFHWVVSLNDNYQRWPLHFVSFHWP